MEEDSGFFTQPQLQSVKVLWLPVALVKALKKHLHLPSGVKANPIPSAIFPQPEYFEVG